MRRLPIALSAGIHPGQIYNWRRQYKRLSDKQFNSLPMTARQNLNQCVADYGEDVNALANFELPSTAEVNGAAV